MKPTVCLGETRTPDGSRFSLHEHDGDYFLKINGEQLMSSTWTLSERLLADHACPGAAPVKAKRVLIGGLGLGFSMKRVVELVGPGAEVVVAELLPEVVQWNREHMADLNGHLMEDPRVSIFEGDVYECILRAALGRMEKWDAILLDTDNGPTALIQPQNHQVYATKGFRLLFDSLTPGARVAFWAAGEESRFEKRLRRFGFRTERHMIKAHERAKKPIHRVYVGEKPG
tara:strand:+ start:768 stop:1454 length:687 start_codon:yes stop_codon:yes gene_type:complete